MLQQILRDMYVDPEILAELPEEQKEMLFFKIRQEQIRRYNERELQQNNSKGSDHKRPNKRGKKVRVLEDSYGYPWTWVYGESKGEITVEEKWQHLHEQRMNRAIQAAMKEEQQKLISERSTEKHRESPTLIGVKNTAVSNNHKLNKLPSSSPNTSPSNAPKFLNREVEKISPGLKGKGTTVMKSNSLRGKVTFSNPPSQQRGQQGNGGVVVVKSQSRIKSEQEKSKSPGAGVATPNIAERLQRGESANTILAPPGKEAAEKKSESHENQQNIEKNKENVKAENLYEKVDLKPHQHEEEVLSHEDWLKQLRQFKEEDKRRSIRARRASKEYRRQSLIAANPDKLSVRFKQLASSNAQVKEAEAPQQRPVVPPKPNGLRAKLPALRSAKLSTPRNREDVKEWFGGTQMSSFAGNQTHFPPWLHGIINRSQAEDLLKHKKEGDFLIRVSDKIYGFTLSYKDSDRVKHFLIDASEPQCYHFLGNDQIRHESLDDLIEYHKEENVSYNGERLKNWIGQTDPRTPDYADLQWTESDTRL